nr:reverse transcriptase domain-containing protein [Tanacetum cinerariifolium]
MSDASSSVTYTSVYTDYEPWRYYGVDSAETGPSRVIVYRYDGLPIQLVAPPSLDYVSGPEHPPSPDYVPGPEHPPSLVEIPYVPKPEYLEYLEPSNDEAPLEDQPLPADASLITASPDYVADSDPKEDPEGDQADYPADGGDGEDEPSDDDDDDDTDDKDLDEEPFEDEEDDDEEEEHQALADSSGVPIVDLTRLHRARKTVRPEPPMSASMEACMARHAALPSPPLLVPSLPLPLPSPLTTSPTNIGAPLGYRAAGIRMRALLPSTSRMTDIPEADMPPRKRACLTTPAPRFEIRESFAVGAARQPRPTESDLRRYRVEQAGYRITDMLDEIVDMLVKIALATLEGVNERVTELDTIVKQRTDEFEIRFKEEKDDWALLRPRVNTLFRDRPDHDVSYAMPWAAVKRMIIGKYFPRGKIQKLESEYWNLKVKGLDMLNYNHRFQELALMCERMFLEEAAKVERYIGGLPDMILLCLLNSLDRCKLRLF